MSVAALSEKPPAVNRCLITSIQSTGGALPKDLFVFRFRTDQPPAEVLDSEVEGSGGLRVGPLAAETTGVSANTERSEERGSPSSLSSLLLSVTERLGGKRKPSFRSNRLIEHLSHMP